MQKKKKNKPHQGRPAKSQGKPNAKGAPKPAGNTQPKSAEKAGSKVSLKSASGSADRGGTGDFVNDRYMLIATLFLAAIYFIYSAVSEGMYQHDEAGHFVNMRSFWHNPNIILGNWPKVGYKLLYAVPSLFGEGVVTVVNCFVAAFTAYFCYKIVSQLNGKFALLAFVLLAAQPMWVQLSFRHYSEITTAFLIVLSLHFLFRNKLVPAAFILAYICLIRQEFFLMLAMFGIYLLIKRNFRAIIIASIPIILYNIWGGVVNNDPFYLISEVLETSSTYGDAFPRQGFEHYPLVSEIIFGITAIVLFFLYMGAKAINRSRINWFIVTPAVLFFLMHSVFNSQTLEFGPSSGGNHRYMAVISPLIAILGALSIDEALKVRPRYLLLVVFLPVLLVTGFFWSFQPDGIHLGDVREWRPLLVGAAVALLLLLPIKNRAIITAGLVLIMVSSTAGSIQPIPNSSENETMEEVVRWYNMETRRSGQSAPGGYAITPETPVFAQHVLFFYYQDKTAWDFHHKVQSIVYELIDSAALGSLIIWDSHYSYRPKQRSNTINDRYFLDRPMEFTLINTFESEGNFNVKAFVKTGVRDVEFEAGKELFDNEEYQEALEKFQLSTSFHPENYVSWYFAGRCHQELQDYNAALAYYNQSLLVNPNYEGALLARGRLWTMANRLDEAMQDLNRYVQLNPDEATGYFTRAGAYFAAEEFEKALQDYAVVARLAPNFAQTYYSAGLAQIRLNQVQSACANFNKAKVLGHAQADAAINQYCSGLNR